MPDPLVDNPAERTVAYAVLWEDVMGDLTAEELRGLVTRITERLIVQGWTPPAPDNGSPEAQS